MTRNEVRKWILQRVAEKDQTQAELLGKMEEKNSEVKVAKATFENYKNELIDEGYIEVIFQRRENRKKPDAVIALKPRGITYLQRLAEVELKKGEPDFVHNLALSKQNLEKLHFQMQISGMTDPQAVLGKILDYVFDIETDIWILAGGAAEFKRETTTEEHLAVLRDIGNLLEPFLTCVKIPVPIDYVPEDKVTDDNNISTWIRNLREEKKKQSTPTEQA